MGMLLTEFRMILGVFGLLVLLVAFSLMMGCSSTLAPNAVAKPTYEYNFSQNHAGLGIAVDPFFEKERLKDSFDGDLLAYGILPILIVIDNHHPKLAFLLEQKYFYVATKVEEQGDTHKGSDPTISMSKTSTAVGYTGLGLVGLGGMIMMSPVTVGVGFSLLLYGAVKETEIQKINENLRRKAFADRTIYPGESHSGFLYFQIKNREMRKNIEAIVITAKELSSDKELTFVFQMKGGIR